MWFFEKYWGILMKCLIAEYIFCFSNFPPIFFQFPEALGRLTKNLRTLDLSHNKLVTLPPSIGQFTMLKSIIVSGNRLGNNYRKHHEHLY